MEEIGVPTEGEAAPLPEAFFADEEVDVLSLQTIFDRLEAFVDVHRRSSLLDLLR